MLLATTLAILLGLALILLSLYILFDLGIRSRLGISLSQFMESVSILSSLSSTNKHKSLEFLVQSMIRCNMSDKERLESLREDINNTLDKIDRIPYMILSEQDRLVRDSLTLSSQRIGTYIYSL